MFWIQELIHHSFQCLLPEVTQIKWLIAKSTVTERTYWFIKKNIFSPSYLSARTRFTKITIFLLYLTKTGSSTVEVWKLWMSSRHASEINKKINKSATDTMIIFNPNLLILWTPVRQRYTYDYSRFISKYPLNNLWDAIVISCSIL